MTLFMDTMFPLDEIGLVASVSPSLQWLAQFSKHEVADLLCSCLLALFSTSAVAVETIMLLMKSIEQW
jgi:hypothetical protein